MRAYAAHVKFCRSFTGVDGDSNAGNDTKLCMVAAIAFYYAAQAGTGAVRTEPAAVCLQRAGADYLTVGKKHLNT